jgi:NadR type nicotinamide-nucleotide adenylyltransferase
METFAPDGKQRRVVLTGSESTGKTVLARELAAHFGAVLVPEFSRQFAEPLGREIVYEDAEAIARGQIALEDERWTCGAALVIQDTDLLSTAVYSALYFGRCEQWIRTAARERRPDLYLLMEIDVPWVADNVRDMGGRREEVQERFREAVESSGTPYAVVSGNWDERRDQARDAIERLLTGAPSDRSADARSSSLRPNT